MSGREEQDLQREKWIDEKLIGHPPVEQGSHLWLSCLTDESFDHNEF